MPGISITEMNRRWNLVREAMQEKKLDFLIIQSSINIFPGSVRWLTDLIVTDGYTVSLIFPRNGEMTAFLHGSMGDDASTIGKGVKKCIYSPMLPTLASSYLQAEQVVAELTSYKNSRIGFAGMNLIAAGFYKYIIEHMPSAKFEDATDLMDTLKAIKSDEELAFIRETCRIQDELFSGILPHIQAGKKVGEIRSELIHQALNKGCSSLNIVLWMSQPGKPLIRPNRGQILKEGDQIDVMLETDGPSGFWGEISRPVYIGKASAELKEHVELSRQLQKLTVEALKPSAKPIDIWEANNASLRKMNCQEERRIFAHGQGYDMVERPCLDKFESMPVQGKMLMAVHPQALSQKALGWLCDNFFVKETGTPEWLHRTPQRVFEV
jgi:Xaa-Pro aminopeptidase